MTRYEAIIRQLGDIEKSHERALTKRDMQIRLLCGYRDELEDKSAIALEIIANAFVYGNKDDAAKLIDDRYEALQAARRVAAGA